MLAIELMQLLGKVRCYYLEPGSIHETVRVMEAVLGEDSSAP